MMTKTDFESRYYAIFNDFLKNNINNIQSRIQKHGNENGKVSAEEVAAIILTESLVINRDFLKQILEEFLPIDEL